ncbi:MAG: protein translocase subunit SecF [Herpetosiphonaceae bacterium]|nr:protein translocase subunit SecF [Herpetosiphonaceae bacterium]
MLNVVNKRYLFFALSLLVIIPGLVSLGLFGLHAGIDFTGGTAWELVLPNQTQPVAAEDVQRIFSNQNFGGNANVQVSPPNAQKQVLVSVRTPVVKDVETKRGPLLQALQAKYPQASIASLDTVGATVSSESRNQAVVAVLAASAAILLYMTVAFRKASHPVRYGVTALMAMLHDVLVVLGIASIFGKLFGLEVDALFLTALLTVISFSVHDTIVVYDRVRENQLHRRTNQSFEEVVNLSIVQTLARSINTQLTALLTLLALSLFGGRTIRDFVLILMIGLVSGTYSSIFNAAQLLVVWENGWGRDWRRVFGHKELHTTTAKVY